MTAFRVRREWGEMTTGSGSAQGDNAESPKDESLGADLDAIAGISEEEQRAIVAQINGIAESNRRSLIAFDDGSGKRGARVGAKKKGGLLPVLVNLFAAIVLVGGFFALAAFQGEEALRAREGVWTFNPMERALIDAIRRETGALLAQADVEIFALLYRLDGVEGRLRELAGMEELTPEEEADEARLLAQRDEYRADLEAARQERARILAEARARESEIQAQRDSRVHDEMAAAGAAAGAFSGPPTETGAGSWSAEIHYAREELSALAEDWERAAMLESMIAAFFESARRQIADRRFYEAGGTIRALREFLDSADFRGLRDARFRNEIFASAANSLESLLEENRAVHETLIAATSPQSPGFHVVLQREIVELERRLEAADYGAENYARIVGLLESDVGYLRLAYDALYEELAGLLSANEELSARAEGLERRAEALETIIESLTNQLNQLRQAIR